MVFESSSAWGRTLGPAVLLGSHQLGLDAVSWDQESRRKLLPSWISWPVRARVCPCELSKQWELGPCRSPAALRVLACPRREDLALQSRVLGSMEITPAVARARTTIVFCRHLVSRYYILSMSVRFYSDSG